MGASESWKAAYSDLINTIVRMGYPEEFGKLIAKNLGSEKTMQRMTSYLNYAKPRSAEEQGGLIKAESALYADKVQLICPKCGRPTRVGHKINAKGKKVRVCKKSDCLAEFE